LSTIASRQELTAADVARSGRPTSGLNYFIAKSLDEVVEAWRVVYAAYERDGLIEANPYSLHTTPQAVGPNTVVVTACIGPVPVGTISAYADGPGGLPLDTVYRDQLDALRGAGRRLVEVGLFADRREHLNRSAEGLFELMRYAFFFATYRPADDIVIGVHPRHAAFYERFLACEQIGSVTTYPIVRDRKVVLLRLNLRQAQHHNPLPKGLAYFFENQVSPALFEHRFNFDNTAVSGSVIDQFLSARAERGKSAA
jgi:hypothetical protein